MKLSITWWLIVLCSAVLILYVGGCVDVNNADVSAVDLRSSVKFINLSTVGSGVNVKIDSVGVVSSLAYTTGSPYLDLASGTRFFSVIYTGVSATAITDTFRNALTPNYKSTYFIVCDPSAGDSTRSYLLYPERQTFNGTVITIAGKLLVRFINLTKDTAAAVTGGVQFHLNYGATDTTTASALAFAGASPYYQVALSDTAKYYVLGTDDASTSVIPLTTLSGAQGRVSVVLYGVGTLKTIVLKED